MVRVFFLPGGKWMLQLAANAEKMCQDDTHDGCTYECVNYRTYTSSQHAQNDGHNAGFWHLSLHDHFNVLTVACA